MDNKQQEELAKRIAFTAKAALDEKQGVGVTVLAVAKATVLADYFVICSGDSSTQVKALADNTEFVVNRDLGIKPSHTEGFGDNTWSLIDYGSVVVHIFTAESRDFYKLEKLWKDSEAEAITE